jgi:hypothetical protein
MDDRVYSLALFIHVLAVSGLFVGIGLELFQITVLRRAQTVGQVQQLDLAESVLKVLMPVATIFILASGLFMIIKGWSWSAHWAEVAFVSLVIAAGIGNAVLGRTSERIGKAAHQAPPGALPASLRAQIMDPMYYTAAWLLAALAIGILYLMTNKPGTLESIAVMVLAAIVGVATARLTDKAPARGAEAAERDSVLAENK